MRYDNRSGDPVTWMQIRAKSRVFGTPQGFVKSLVVTGLDRDRTTTYHSGSESSTTEPPGCGVLTDHHMIGDHNTTSYIVQICLYDILLYYFVCQMYVINHILLYVFSVYVIVRIILSGNKTL
jgi:hypothetical protein